MTVIEYPAMRYYKTRFWLYKEKELVGNFPQATMKAELKLSDFDVLFIKSEIHNRGWVKLGEYLIA